MRHVLGISPTQGILENTRIVTKVNNTGLSGYLLCTELSSAVERVKDPGNGGKQLRNGWTTIRTKRVRINFQTKNHRIPLLLWQVGQIINSESGLPTYRLNTEWNKFRWSLHHTILKSTPGIGLWENMLYYGHDWISGHRPNEYMTKQSQKLILANNSA